MSGEDVKKIIAAHGFTQQQVADMLGKSRANLNGMLGKDDVRTGLLEDISRVTGIPLEDFLIGPRGAIFSRKTNMQDDDVTRVKLIPYEARGGMIGDFVDGVHDYDCETVISPIKGVDFAMTVTGDSMMPEYNPGDRILIKRIDPNIFIEWGRVYVLDTPNGAVLKKLEKADDPEYVTCISINPDVSPFQVNVNAVRGWYRVLLVMSMK